MEAEEFAGLDMGLASVKSDCDCVWDCMDNKGREEALSVIVIVVRSVTESVSSISGEAEGQGGGEEEVSIVVLPSEEAWLRHNIDGEAGLV